jgi:uncharacterized protein YndB with AHSA1/START domain
MWSGIIKTVSASATIEPIMDQPKTITVETTIKAPPEKVWEYFTKPQHIRNWAFASDDWEAPAAENDLKIGGRFKTTMAAKDKSASFDFAGTYTRVLEHELIEYDIDPDKTGADGVGPASRHVTTVFAHTGDGVKVSQTFDPEHINSEDMQRSGWQGILNNFKKYVEAN